MLRFAQFFTIIVVVGVLASLPSSLNVVIKEASLDLQFNIRGNRPLSDKLVIVYIDDEDLRSLGGWPISRDYYSYAIHILSRSGARVIGLDVFFSKADQKFPEFDRILTEFIRAAGNVCIPLYFSELKENPSNPSGILIAENPNLPFEDFRRASAGLGYSNLGWQTKISELPLIVSSQDSLFSSFGCELARLYMKGIQPVRNSGLSMIISDSLDNEHEYELSRNCKLRLNHFGSLENIRKISFVRLVTDYAVNPHQFDFRDKIVVIMMAASGISPVVQTPLSKIVPASLIHVTTAENLLEKNYIRELPFFSHLILIAVMLSAAYYCLRQKKKSGLVAWIIICSSAFLIISFVVFRIYNLFIPIFYPALAFVTMLMYGSISSTIRMRREENMMRNLLHKQVNMKESELHKTKEILAELQQEIKQKSDVTEQTKNLAEERYAEILRLQNEINDLKAYMISKKDTATPQFKEIICSSGGTMSQILDMLHKIGSDDISVLITGETGTGKELIARAIHNSSKRKGKPFVAMNCGALSETLLESELFGHEKGSFTGAISRRIGRFEQAHGGTIFLDEISETSQAFQVKLLRILQESTFERVGGQESIRLNIRIIAATNKNLQQAMEAGRFRSDLFYRLNGFPIELPPLRERVEDIPLLAAHFLQKLNSESVTRISDRAISILKAYHWPGNVRELENVIHRALILAQSTGRDIIQEADLSLSNDNIAGSAQLDMLHKPLEEQILEMLRALKFEHAAISKTAKALGNRDRGTITEHFRGICFMEYVRSDFNRQKTVQNIAGTTDSQVIDRVDLKLSEYLDNLSDVIRNSEAPEAIRQPYKGLPKKYHAYLDRLVTYLRDTIHGK